jgi:excisionase family DNA binding protein
MSKQSTRGREAIDTDTDTDTGIEPAANNEPERDSNAPTIIDASQVADLLGINRGTVYERAKAGDIPCRRVGRRFLFVREVLIEWLQSRAG